MKLYLAGPYGDRLRLKEKADQLSTLGFEITSRWVHGDHDLGRSTEDFRNYAEEDWQDIINADALILFIPQQPDRAFLEPYSTTGGHHVELGIALDSGKEILLIGQPANIFHLLPRIHTFEHWNNDVITTLANLEMTLKQS